MLNSADVRVETWGSRIRRIGRHTGFAGALRPALTLGLFLGATLSNAEDPGQPGATADAQGPAQPTPVFGTPCTQDTATTACTGITNYCTANPYAPAGYCTAQGCDKTPTLCPAGYTCKQMFTSPFFCMKQ